MRRVTDVGAEQRVQSGEDHRRRPLQLLLPALVGRMDFDRAIGLQSNAVTRLSASPTATRQARLRACPATAGRRGTARSARAGRRLKRVHELLRSQCNIRCHATDPRLGVAAARRAAARGGIPFDVVPVDVDERFHPARRPRRRWPGWPRPRPPPGAAHSSGQHRARRRHDGRHRRRSARRNRPTPLTPRACCGCCRGTRTRC